MLSAEELEKYCSDKIGAYRDLPFGTYPICYKLNGKVFAQIYPQETDYKITLKCNMDEGYFFREVYPDVVVRGYHCPPVQQPYWNTIYINKIDDHILLDMIDIAYQRVFDCFSKKIKSKILVNEYYSERIKMKTKKYLGYIIDKSQKDKNIFNNLTVTNRKSIWFGLITIYEVQISLDDMDEVIKNIQRNMVKHIGFIKKKFYAEFYAHFYSGNELIVVFREKTFHITADRSTWKEAQAYGKRLGIIEKQLDFLSPEENKKRYFS